MKYGTWKTAQATPEAVDRLLAAGYGSLAAVVLSARGLDTPEKARAFLRYSDPLPDPFLMKDMDKAVERVKQALERNEHIAIFGDYDVDGITATCLLTNYLRTRGARCTPYIPGRLEEGYGLNPIGLEQLSRQGVKLIITVDCGITAIQEALLCQELGMELVITDHHECKSELPQAVAVVDPHRKDCPYPHRNLSGVGVAFKLAAALEGNQEAIMSRYADMVCLGTVADVMPLVGENRVFVTRGIRSLQRTTRPGLKSLMYESGCDPANLTAGSIGYVLAPRINAAGRMGRIDLALELFLTKNPMKGAEAAKSLCLLNRQRQAVETEIYQEAVAMLSAQQSPEAIVLASPRWHQGVVGIVASRMAEEYCCPAFLICLDGEKGKASSRSYGGFNLFAALQELSDLLETYGGHELAAGFTITGDHIDEFRHKICLQARAFYQDATPRTTLDIDCVVSPELLTLHNVAGLDLLEPCGPGCPKPVFLLERLTIDRLIPVGNGRHLRLRLRSDSQIINAICFCATAGSLSVREGDLVDLACTLQINEFRGNRSVQVNLVDIRPSCPFPCDTDPTPYRRLRNSELSPAEAATLLPSRQILGDIWRYLSAHPRGSLRDEPVCLCRKIIRHTGRPLSLAQMLICLDIFREAGLLTAQRNHNNLSITIVPVAQKVDLNQCDTMRLLLRLKGVDL